MSGPLEGIQVVSLEHALAAPISTCRLRDAGARVIKIERPEIGDFARGYDDAVNGQSAYFVWANRGKESIALDLRDADDLALLKRIIASSDVFIQNLGPGAAARAGLGESELRQIKPDLITCAISGYGEDGEFAHRRAYDLLVQAESGIASVTGTADAPGRIGVSACDISAGLAAYSAILEAIILRGRTGTGKSIKISMFQTMAEWMAVPLLHYEHRGYIWPRVGLAHPSIVPYGSFPASDGKEILIGIQNDGEWRRFLEHCPEVAGQIDAEATATNIERVNLRDNINGAVANWTKQHTSDEIVEM